MSIERFTYASTDLYATIRTTIIDGEPWFVLADLCKVLDLTTPARVAERIDPKGVSQTHIPTAGGTQKITIVSEPGMYEVVFRSDKPEAATFRRWITGTVLPTIRKTGTYSTAPTLTDDELIHQALSISATRVAALTERVAELEPKALVAEKLLDATGDYEVADAAKVLSRSGVTTGRGRLFGDLHRRGWIYRHQGDGKWRVRQSALDVGYMTELPQSHYHPKTGILVLDPPQPRVTPKGIARILKDYNHTGELVKA
ncbi:BRO family protein [Rhodococcus erythropolis]